MSLKIDSGWLDNLNNTLCHYSPIPEKEWEKAKAFLYARSLKKDDFFIRAGETPELLGFIASGLFRVFYVTDQGDEKTLIFRDENNFISAYSSFLEKTEAPYSIQALEDSTVIYLTLDHYEQLRKGHHCWHLMSAKYTERLFLEKEARENEFLTLDAKQRYLRFIGKNPELSKRIALYQIASYLGISPVSLSRIRSGKR